MVRIFLGSLHLYAGLITCTVLVYLLQNDIIDEWRASFAMQLSLSFPFFIRLTTVDQHHHWHQQKLCYTCLQALGSILGVNSIELPIYLVQKN